MVVRLFHILSFGSFKALFALGMGRVRWGVRQARRVCRARRLWVVSWVGEGGEELWLQQFKNAASAEEVYVLLGEHVYGGGRGGRVLIDKRICFKP